MSEDVNSTVELLSPKDKFNLMFAVDKAIDDHFLKDVPANEALAKSSMEYGLSDELVKVATRFFNTSKTLAFYQKYPNKKEQEFELADIDVISDLRKKAKAKPQEKSVINKKALYDFKEARIKVEDFYPEVASLVKTGHITKEQAQQLNQKIKEQDMRFMLIDHHLLSKPLIKRAQIGVFMHKDPLDIKEKFMYLTDNDLFMTKIANQTRWYHPDVAIMLIYDKLNLSEALNKQAELLRLANEDDFEEKSAVCLGAIDPQEKTAAYEKRRLRREMQNLLNSQQRVVDNLIVHALSKQAETVKALEKIKPYNVDLEKLERAVLLKTGNAGKAILQELYKQAGYDDREVKFPEVRIENPYDFTKQAQRVLELMTILNSLVKEAKYLELAKVACKYLEAVDFEKRAIIETGVKALQKATKSKSISPSADIDLFIESMKNLIANERAKQYAIEFTSTDPYLQQYPEDVLYSNVRDLIEVAPSLMQNKEILRSVLAKKLAQGGRLELEELMSLINAEFTKRRIAEKEVAELQRLRGAEYGRSLAKS